MSTPLYGQPWRGFGWDYWAPIVTKPKKAAIEKIIHDHASNTMKPLRKKALKPEMVARAMQLLDEYKPPLSNDRVKEIFSAQLQVSTHKSPSSLPQAPPQLPNPPPNFPSAIQLGTKSTAAPKKPIFSQSSFCYDFKYISQLIDIFLQETYYQSWQLEPGCFRLMPGRSLVTDHIISSPDSLRIALDDTSNPDISFLKVAFTPQNNSPRQNYRFSDAGALYPYRGRGPVWENNSCALDCCIVAARLMDLGCVVADRGNQTRGDWLASLPDLEKNFQTLLARPWERASKQNCISFKNAFSPHLFKAMNPAKPDDLVGKFLPVNAIWRLCTANMHQYSFTHSRYSACKFCVTNGRKATDGLPQILQSVDIDELNEETKQAYGEKPTMSQLLNYYFAAHSRNCPGCGGQGTREVRRRVHGQLPSRLVVEPALSYREAAIGETSYRIPILYEDPAGNSQEAVYRWLGGIFQSSGHFRLYWTDCRPHDPSGSVMIYDGMQLDGAIIGSVVPIDPDTKVPTYWSGGTNLLFYERIEVENDEGLQSAAKSIKGNIDRLLTRQPQPWPYRLAKGIGGKRKASSSSQGSPINKKTKTQATQTP